MPLGPISPITPISPSSFTSPTSATGGVAGSSGNSFASMLGEQLDKVSDAQATADQLALQAATGDLQSIQDYTIASTEAQLLTQLTVTVRNKAVEAFNDIMRMQV